MSDNLLPNKDIRENILYNLPVINFFSIILICFIHSYNSSFYGLNYELSTSGVILVFEDIVSQGIAHIATPLFFFISGFLMFISLKYENYNNKIKRRFHSLFLPYVSWNFIYFLIFFILTNIDAISVNLSSVEKVDFSFIDIFEGIIFHKWNYIMWFIYQLMIYHLISILFIPFLNKFPIGLLTISIPFALYSIGLLEIPSNLPFGEGIYPDMLFYYLLGGLIALNINNYSTKLYSGSLWLGKFFIVIASWLILWILNREQYKEWTFDVINILCNTLGILSILILAANTKIKKFTVPVAPFLIFAVHPILVEVIQKLNWVLLPHNCYTALLDYLGSVIISVAVIIMIGKLAEKHIPKVYKFLIGNR